MKTTPTNKEVFFDKDSIIVSKTDTKGKITYANEHFLKIAGFDEKELIGQPHNIIRHPDMPKVIFKWLWESLHKETEVHAYVKNITKDGSFYWVFANVTPSQNLKGETIGYYSTRRVPSKEALAIIEPLYVQLLQAERAQGMQASEAILQNLLDEKGVDYEEFILSI